jgi:Zn-finger protein
MKNGIKDCSSCLIPHTEDGYDYILEVINNTIYQKSSSAFTELSGGLRK